MLIYFVQDSLLENLPADIPASYYQHVQTASDSDLECSTPGFDDASPPRLNDFLVDSASFEADEGMCIRRSNGRMYAIKKLLQTRQTWSELDILQKIKEAGIPFTPTLHWTYEIDQHIYLIMVCISAFF